MTCATLLTHAESIELFKALGAKMTGAGGGGCMFALAPKRDEALRLQEVLGEGAFVAEVSA